MSLRRHLPTAIICGATIVLSIGGGATAAGLITGDDIKDGSVTSADIKNLTVTGKDISSATKQALRGADGAPGTDGTNGADGADGADGVGLEGFAFHQQVATAVPANTNDFVVEGDCPTGQSIIGAWAYWATDNSPLQVSVGYINDTTMAAVAYSTGIATSQNATLQYSCATIPQPAASTARQMLPEVR